VRRFAPVRRCTTAVLACLAIGAPEPRYAWAASPSEESRAEVESLLGRATELFQAERYDEAIALFEEAYALDPEANYLFNIGRVYEEKGELQTALSYYERFVRHPEAEPEAIAMTQARIDALVAELEQLDPPAPPPEPEPDPPPPPVETHGDSGSPPSSRARLRIAGYSLIGGGAALAAIGGGFAGAALTKQRELDSLSTLESRNEAIDKGQRYALVADALFIAGGVVALTGLILTLATLGRSRSQARSKSRAFGVAANGVLVHF